MEGVVTYYSCVNCGSTYTHSQSYRHNTYECPNRQRKVHHAIPDISPPAPISRTPNSL